MGAWGTEAKARSLTGQLEERGDGLLPPLGILGNEGQLHQPQQEDELAGSQGHRGYQVAGPHHVKLHWGGERAIRAGLSLQHARHEHVPCLWPKGFELQPFRFSLINLRVN